MFSAMGQYFVARLSPQTAWLRVPARWAAGRRSRNELTTVFRDDEEEEETARRRQVETVSDLFDCPPDRAGRALDTNPELYGRIPQLSRLVAVWRRLGLKPVELLNSDRVFTASECELTEHADFLQVWRSKNFKPSPDLIRISTDDVKRYTELVKKHAEKIRQFATVVECSDIESCKLFSKYSLLAKSKPATLKKKLDTLIEGGVEREDLVKDLWIVTYTEARLRERLELARELKLSPIKPWMLRCNKRTIHRTWSNREENRAAMAPFTDSKDYLCQRLGATRDQLEAFSSRHPPAMRVQVAKLKEVIDFLLSEGFTQEQIYNTPRILCHSLNTIRERLNKLRERKYEPYTLSLLCKSENYFNNFLQKITPFSAKSV